MAGFYFGAAAIADLGQLVDVRAHEVIPLMVIVLLMLPLVALLYRFTSVHFELRWRRLGPGARDYDQHMHREIVRAVAHQGRMPIDHLAKHLSIRRADLDAALVALRNRGHAPMYVDRERGELVSLHARDATDRACPSCGAALEVAPTAGVVCDFCGADFLGGLTSSE